MVETHTGRSSRTLLREAVDALRRGGLTEKEDP